MIGLVAAAGCVVFAVALMRLITPLERAIEQRRLRDAIEDAEALYRRRDWDRIPACDSERIVPLIRRRQRITA